MNYIKKYHSAITSGKIVAGKWIRLLYDKIMEGLKSKKYRYDKVKAEHAINWIEAHSFHTEGPLAPQPLKLELWQKAMVSLIFGIVDKKKKRIFREVVLVVARKNGKSLFASAIAKYVLYEDGGFGARIFCTAPKLDQADIIYESTWMMIQLDPEWQQLKAELAASKDEHNKFTKDDSELCRRRQKDIYIPATNSSIKKVAFSEKKSDGFNPSLVVCDEVASWQGAKGLKQYEVFKSGMGAREMGDNPSILLSCTTSGYENDSIYDELILRSTRFLLGESEESKLLPLLYMIDDIDKWDDIEELKKSNPNLGVSVSKAYLQEEIAIARGSLSKKSEFITKYCNLKQNSSAAWLSAQAVKIACGDELSLEDFRGCYCVGGIDLSRTTDLSACNVTIEKNGELYIFAKFFLPGGKIEEATQRDGLPYSIYMQRGLLEASGDNFIDYHDCFNWFVELVEKYEILPLKVGYDRYSAQYLVQDMKTYGFHMDDVYQGDNLWPVIQEFEGLLNDGKIHIGNNDLLKIHFLNSAIKMSVERGRGKLIKLNAKDHIDGMAAVLDSFTVRQKWYTQIGSQLINED